MSEIYIDALSEQALVRMIQSGQPIVPVNHGYWTVRGTPDARSRGTNGGIPEWYLPMRTILRMEKNGLVVNAVDEDSDERDEYHVTDLAVEQMQKIAPELFEETNTEEMQAA